LRAEHRETSPGSLDTSSGLLSALGGADVHAMSFAGSEILPAENAGGTGVALEESFESGSEPTNWVSHPSGIGYRRNSPGIATWTGSGSGSTSSTGTPFAGNAPTMDSGMSDGASGEELTRLANYMTGGNENPSSTQPGPTSRAEQIAGLGNPAVVLCGDGLSPNDSSVMNQGGKMGANLNNRMNVGGYFFGFLGSAMGAGGGGGTGTGAASHSGLSGSEQSGRTGQQGQGTAGGGLPGPASPGSPPAGPVPGSQTPSLMDLGIQRITPNPTGPVSPAPELADLFRDPSGGLDTGPSVNPEVYPPGWVPLDDVSSGQVAGFFENLDRFSNPLLSVESSGTNPDNSVDKALHYGMQVANLLSLVDLPVAFANLGRLGLNGLRALRGVEAGKDAVDAARLANLAREAEAANAARLAEAAKASETAGVVAEKAGTSVIGHTPDYVNMAQDLKANYFKVPAEQWNALSETEKWAANQKFLDEAIARADIFRLATPLDKVREGSVLQQEIQYLSSKGYRLNADATALIPPVGR
jgi:hypothetical protein